MGSLLGSVSSNDWNCLVEIHSPSETDNKFTFAISIFTDFIIEKIADFINRKKHRLLHLN